MARGEIRPTAQLLGLSTAEAKIIQKESSFKPTAKNKYSTAFGLWQGIEAQRAKYADRFGYDANTTNPYEQIDMFRAYVKDRYGTAEAALNFQLARGYY